MTTHPDGWAATSPTGSPCSGSRPSDTTGSSSFERRDGQVFRADLVLGIDTREAARTDDLQHTVDYGSLVAKVKNAIESDPVDLIETLAQRIADVCLADPRVQWTEVTVHKPDAPWRRRSRTSP